MSVASILTDLTTEIGTLLGANWSELDYIYDLEKNNWKNSDKRYGVGVRGGSSVSGTNKAITVDQEFFVVLTETFRNKHDDGNERTVLSDIYNQFDTIKNNIFQSKINNSSSVLVVSELSYEEPTNPDEGIVSVTMNFIVKYRNQTT